VVVGGEWEKSIGELLLFLRLLSEGAEDRVRSIIW
jgi:hypothetical protein